MRVKIGNSKGISILFLIITMLLMVAIGYVFSYLIPMKQKTVKFPIYSNQALFIAQSGIEFAIRYTTDQGWRGATDTGIFDLDRLDGVARPLGNGTLILNYDQPTNTLTSTGQITGSSENRVVRVSNFSPFLRLVFDSASPAPCWCLGTRRVRLYIQNVRSAPVILQSFSATWTQTGPARRITRIDMNGVQKYAAPGTQYYSGNPPQNFNLPLGSPSQTINPGQLIVIVVRWSNNLGNPANINFYFYTGLAGAGDSYRFNLDPSGNNLPNCAVGC